MRGWQIDPGGVDRVLRGAASEAGELTSAFARNRLEALDDDLARTGPVGSGVRAAVQQLLMMQAQQVATAGQDASAGIRGVAAAATNYAHAQHEMGTTTRSTATVTDSATLRPRGAV
ncbi:DUF6507 family protein [Pseudactinotalea terrae]|uniref:DUF6507 family protein n=1 Tax=Pseudactinotalea terrae TaxID=1743262 RepID=UPI0012E18A0B|nr:DUF6507 family protein [Pseudactinotalea terrae]